jgi:hypothetical protein
MNPRTSDCHRARRLSSRGPSDSVVAVAGISHPILPYRLIDNQPAAVHADTGMHGFAGGGSRVHASLVGSLEGGNFELQVLEGVLGGPIQSNFRYLGSDFYEIEVQFSEGW